jgi:rhomboid protease GluP
MSGDSIDSIDFTTAQPAEAVAEVAEAERSGRHLSLWNYPATYTLLGINLVIFAIMFGSGLAQQLWHAHAWTQLLTASFDIATLQRFGATDAALILQDNQWWRLVTGTFVHVTMLHVLLNMWCLWNLGLFGEPLLGRRGLVAVYLLTGTAGMLLSLIVGLLQGQLGVVAGASGSVFGLAGILIVLLSNRKLAVPWNELRGLRRQVIFFAVANLVIGMAPHFAGGMLPRIDNTAHLGGLLSGLALGLPLFPKMTVGRKSYRARQTWTFAIATLLLCLIAGAVRSLIRNVTP